MQGQLAGLWLELGGKRAIGRGEVNTGWSLVFSSSPAQFYPSEASTELLPSLKYEFLWTLSQVLFASGKLGLEVQEVGEVGPWSFLLQGGSTVSVSWCYCDRNSEGFRLRKSR